MIINFHFFIVFIYFYLSHFSKFIVFNDLKINLYKIYVDFVIVSRMNSVKLFNNYVYYIKHIIFILFVLILHYEFKMIHYKYCTRNIFIYYLMNKSNLCIYLDTYTRIIENCISFKVDTIIHKLI